MLLLTVACDQGAAPMGTGIPLVPMSSFRDVGVMTQHCGAGEYQPVSAHRGCVAITMVTDLCGRLTGGGLCRLRGGGLQGDHRGPPRVGGVLLISGFG